MRQTYYIIYIVLCQDKNMIGEGIWPELSMGKR